MRKQRSEDYSGYREAGLRLTEPMPAKDAKLRTEHAGPLIRAVHEFDKAHLVMLAEESLVPREAAALMAATLLEIEGAGMEAARAEAGGGIHSGEQMMIRRHGEEVGGWLALARSSNDLGALSTRMLQRDALLAMMAGLNALRGATLALAAEHVESVMPGYVSGRHGQPVTLGHQLAAWAAAFERDFERLAQTYGRVNESPAGAGVATGSDFAIDRGRVAELLGFDRPIRNTFDAVMNRDTVLDSFCAMTILNADLARLAKDILLLNANEYALVEIPDEFCGTSSIMAQSKNPGVLHVITAASAGTLGALTSAVMVDYATTGENIVERSSSLQALDKAHADTIRDLRLLRALLPGLRWDVERMAALAGRHWAQATDVAGALVREKGMPWRSAHQITGILVRLSEERGIAPADVTTALLDEAAVEYMGEPAGLSEQALAGALDARHFVEARAAVHGGPAPADVEAQIAELIAALERDEASQRDAAGQLKAAAAQLQEGVTALVQSTTAGVQ